MKQLLLSLLASALFAPALAHGDLSPAHGGVIVEGKLLTIELLAKADSLTVYLSDHGQDVDAKGASAEVILLSGADKAVAKLTPSGGNGLSAKGNFKVGAGSKAIVKVNLPGKGGDQVRLTIK